MFVFFFSNFLKEVHFLDLLLILVLNLIITNSIFSYFMKNPVYSLIFLILNYSLTGFLFIVNGLAFLGMVFMLVYVGAISILLLFIIMLLNLKSIYYKSANFFYAYFFLYLCFFFEIIFIFIFVNNNEIFFYDSFYYLNWFKLVFLKTDLVNIAFELFVFNSDLLCFIGVFLTVVMLAAVNIVNNIKTSKKQDKHLQLKNYRKITYAFNK